MTEASELRDQLAELARAGGVVARAPGRANLIGEHTDYNDGLVLPVALELSTFVAGRRRDGVCALSSGDERARVEVDLYTGDGPVEGWGRYVTAVVRALRDASVRLEGLDGAVRSDVPIGAGLSSSAALEVAVALALAAEPLEPVRVAEVCRRAENEYVGVETGIMDQLASAGARADHALLIDCRDNSWMHVRVPRSVVVLVVDSGVRRSLGDSAYNERRRECREAAAVLGVASLRDADLERLQRTNDMPDGARRRARHVISENERVLATVEALERDDPGALGPLFAESHRSLRDDFEVSTPELDALVEAASRTPGVLAARLTGAGFGGCTVNLVDALGAEGIAAEVVARYRRATGRDARHWLSRPTDGAGLVAP